MGELRLAHSIRGTLNAQPERLDLRDEWVRKAIQNGVRLVINSDAHNTSELRYPEEFGVGVARRGWAEKKDILNTLPVKDFLGKLKASGKSA